MLIAALGGEGGGVLTNWIMAAAADLGLPAQSTSIPGVAQRTGGTTYYLEIYPMPWKELGNRRPVLALAPGIGDIDILVSSEFMEAGRCIANGFCTPDRTLLISSTSRFYVINEKMALGDGRFDEARLLDVAEKNSQEPHPVRHGAGRQGIRRHDQRGDAGRHCRLRPAADPGRGVRARDPRGRQGGRSEYPRLPRRACRRTRPRRPRCGVRPRPSVTRRSASIIASLEAEIRDQMPKAAQEVLIEGVRRLTRFQDEAYARLFLDRLAPIRELDAQFGGAGNLLKETARHLAVRMSFEDLIRVAQAKIDPARMQRIGQELGAKPGEPYHVTEFLKPGIEEMCQVLPPALARRIIAFSEKRGWLDSVHVGMYVTTTSVFGYLRFWTLAKLRPLRRFMHRYVEEQAQIEHWLGLVGTGREAVACARHRSRRMRAADQGLRFHPQARHARIFRSSKSA